MYVIAMNFAFALVVRSPSFTTSTKTLRTFGRSSGDSAAWSGHHRNIGWEGHTLGFWDWDGNPGVWASRRRDWFGWENHQEIRRIGALNINMGLNIIELISIVEPRQRRIDRGLAKLLGLTSDVYVHIIHICIYIYMIIWYYMYRERTCTKTPTFHLG